MTKMKSKKMTKSTFAIIIMAIVMVAMLAFGGTYAYFTATADGLEGSVQTGSLVLTQDATTFTTMADTKIAPGEYAFGDAGNKEIVSLKHKNTIASYVFVEFDVAPVDIDGKLVAKTGENTYVDVFDIQLTTNDDATQGWKKLQDGVYYYEVTTLYESGEAKALPNFEFSVLFNTAVQSNNAQTGGETHNVYVESGETGSETYTQASTIMGVTLSAKLNFASIQKAIYGDNVASAYADAFDVASKDAGTRTERA